MAAIVALIAARMLVPTARTGPFNIAIGQKAPIVDRIDLFRGPFLDQTGFLQALGEMLGQNRGSVGWKNGRTSRTTTRNGADITL